VVGEGKLLYFLFSSTSSFPALGANAPFLDYYYYFSFLFPSPCTAFFLSLFFFFVLFCFVLFAFCYPGAGRTDENDVGGFAEPRHGRFVAGGGGSTSASASTCREAKRTGSVGSVAVCLLLLLLLPRPAAAEALGEKRWRRRRRRRGRYVCTQEAGADGEGADVSAGLQEVSWRVCEHGACVCKCSSSYACVRVWTLHFAHSATALDAAIDGSTVGDQAGSRAMQSQQWGLLSE